MLLEDVGEIAAANGLWSAATDQLADRSAPRTPALGGDAGTEVVIEYFRSRI